MSDTETFRAFAAAAIIVGARCAQHDGMTSGPFAGPPDHGWEEWIRGVAETLRPLGHDGSLVACALTFLAEEASEWLMYESAAAINRACGPVLKRRTGAASSTNGIIEYGGPERSCFPGTGEAGETEILRDLLDVTRRWSLCKATSPEDGDG